MTMEDETPQEWWDRNQPARVEQETAQWLSYKYQKEAQRREQAVRLQEAGFGFVGDHGSLVDQLYYWDQKQYSTADLDYTKHPGDRTRPN